MRDIFDEIQVKLDEIEQRENVRILLAVESGSRAWGLSSPDSDYDVRFVYQRVRKDYLRLDEKKDTIDWQLDEVLDINGWDLKKALRQFYKGNATLFEWSNSPVVYRKRRYGMRFIEKPRYIFLRRRRYIIIGGRLPIHFTVIYRRTG